MRYLILSDIHGNLTALDAVLKAAEGRWKKAVCLGDLVDYGPDPNEVIGRVQALKAFTIRGNHDKAVVGLADLDEFNPIARISVLWTREQLKTKNRAYLEKLPSGPKQVGGFSIVHGSLHDEDENVFSPELAFDGLQNAHTPVTFFGHTHIQGGFTLRNGQVEVLRFPPAGDNPFSTLTIEPGMPFLLNPGSVGQPRDGDPRAAFAIADLDNQSVEFWRVPYDIGAVQERMARAGLPEPLILRISFGR
jgi:predicted phosphodiesterase